jgi:uncharacterized protein (TIGR02271 family)
MHMTTEATTPDTLFGYDVIGSDGSKIGSVENVWADDATNEAEFVGVKTGWLFGKNNIIPIADAQITDGAITVPYSESQIKDAPSFGADEELSPEQEDEIYSYYGIQRSTSQSPTGLPGGDAGQQYDANASDTLNATDSADVTLSEEDLQVGTREVEAGRVRLRKVVRTEHEEVPVQLRREEVTIERVDATGQDVPDTAFQEQEIDVPVMREEPVVAKEARVTGKVRLDKTSEVETQTVGGEVRREDVEVDQDVDTYPDSTADTVINGDAS